MRLLSTHLIAAVPILLVLSSPGIAWADNEALRQNAAELLRAGEAKMASGRASEALKEFSDSERAFNAVGDKGGQTRALHGQARAQRSLGIHDQAVATLERALARTPGNDARTILWAELGSSYLQTGQLKQAREWLSAALGAARDAGNTRMIAATLNDLATIYDLADEPAPALGAITEATRLAQQTGDSALTLRNALNAARIHLALNDVVSAHRYVSIAIDSVPAVESHALGMQGRIRAGQILVEIARRDPRRNADALLIAHRHLTAALEQAGERNEPLLASAAEGVLGTAYLVNGRLDDALALTRRALGTAQQQRASDLLFRWHWQTGRILGAQRQIEKAIASYRLAAAATENSTLDSLTTDNLFTFESTDTALVELVDLLLQRSSTISEPTVARGNLLEARDVMEKLKAHELQDYFRDSCVADARARQKQLEHNLEPQTAVLYPIVLPDRLELLLSRDSDIKRFTVPVKGERVLETARQFRVALERQRTLTHLAPARALYDWIIRPLEQTLSAWGTTTLITVPDRVLRPIPMAALHDGERFLIDRLAVAMTPGLELTDPRPLPAGNPATLLAGLTEPVHGFPALLHVASELDGIQALFGGHLLVNQTFRREHLERELTTARYSITHIASHGEFSGDVRRSFLLTHDGKITMDELSRFIGFNRVRDDPVDLLTLSACHTAAGDERAALGLAGIAVKAGARTALASLWPIHDEATALLMVEFYRQLSEPGTSKAQALQRAQAKLKNITRYRHPGYWSAFVLIGSWR